MKSSIVSVALVVASTSAFAPIKIQPSNMHAIVIGTYISNPSALHMAGFGGGGMGGPKAKGKKEKKGNKTVVLKPKAQWDRYAALKKSIPVKVAVRVANSEDEVGDWYEVGRVKSENDDSAEIAVVTQRGIIAEVSLYSALSKI